MRATQQLKNEHEGIKVMLRIMTRVSESNGDVNIEHLGKMIDFIKTFADKCHHGKEEEILFPELVKAGMSNENGPIGVMLYEHTEGRGYVKEFSDAYDRYKNGDSSALPEIKVNMLYYVQLLTDHIEKENNVLFMMADRFLSEQEQDEIADAFEKIEIEKIGAGKHEEYHKLLDELQTIYLG